MYDADEFGCSVMVGAAVVVLIILIVIAAIYWVETLAAFVFTGMVIIVIWVLYGIGHFIGPIIFKD